MGWITTPDPQGQPDEEPECFDVNWVAIGTRLSPKGLKYQIKKSLPLEVLIIPAGGSKKSIRLRQTIRNMSTCVMTFTVQSVRYTRVLTSNCLRTRATVWVESHYTSKLDCPSTPVEGDVVSDREQDLSSLAVDAPVVPSGGLTDNGSTTPGTDETNYLEGEPQPLPPSHTTGTVRVMIGLVPPLDAYADNGEDASQGYRSDNVLWFPTLELAQLYLNGIEDAVNTTRRDTGQYYDLRYALPAEEQEYAYIPDEYKVTPDAEGNGGSSVIPDPETPAVEDVVPETEWPEEWVSQPL